MRLSIEKEYGTLVTKKNKLEKELSALPEGYISVKNIKGNIHHYLQRRNDSKVIGVYIPAGEVQRVSDKIERKKQIESEIKQINNRLVQLEQAAKLIDKNLFCRLMIIKMSAGMDELKMNEKMNCASFGSAMNAIEGVPASRQTISEINKWKRGQCTYISVFESTLKRYGFPTEA